MDFSVDITNYINDEIELLKKLNIESINKAMECILKTYENSGTIFICGNGGSAATASHFVVDFNKGVSEFLNKKFNFYCLNDNIPSIMAIANDIGYEYIFEFQLINKLKDTDLLIGISGSGNSKNVIRAIQYAKKQKVYTIGITGYDGGILKGLVDCCLNVPINDMQKTEDIHMVFNHLMMSIFSKKLK